ncbi:hypothetical protein LguiB_001766 [Lonicera macranthoides]
MHGENEVGDSVGACACSQRRAHSRHEGELVKIIVEEILSKLKMSYKHVPENMIGMDNHIEEMDRLLNIDSNGIQIIRILGMGGLGKITIAKILKRESKFDDVKQGIDKIKGVIHRKKVLIVLDNVDNKFQIDKLVRNVTPRNPVERISPPRPGSIPRSIAEESSQNSTYAKTPKSSPKTLEMVDEGGEDDEDDDVSLEFDTRGMKERVVTRNHNLYEARSRIIITTRDEVVLLALEMTCQNEGLHEIYRCYRPKPMDDNLILQLFSKYAFMKDSPPKGYDSLAMEVVSSASGLPLVLMTLGSLLFIEKDKVSWKHKLKKLQALPPLEVLGRSLIIIGDENIICMDDRLKELGEQIICEKCRDKPEKWSRLWRSEDAWNMLDRHLDALFELQFLLPREYSSLAGRHILPPKVIDVLVDTLYYVGSPLIPFVTTQSHLSTILSTLGVTHPGIALAAYSLNFGVLMGSEASEPQKAFYTSSPQGSTHHSQGVTSFPPKGIDVFVNTPYSVGVRSDTICNDPVPPQYDIVRSG